MFMNSMAGSSPKAFEIGGVAPTESPAISVITLAPEPLVRWASAVYVSNHGLRKADPPFGGEILYGDRAEHCWNGDPTQPNAISRLRYHQMYAPKILARILATAPKGADVKSWRY